MKERVLKAFQGHNFELVCMSMGLKYEALKLLYEDVEDLQGKLTEICNHWGGPNSWSTTTAYCRVNNFYLVGLH